MISIFTSREIWGQGRLDNFLRSRARTGEAEWIQVSMMIWALVCLPFISVCIFVCQSFCIIRVSLGFQGGYGLGVESYKERIPI